MGIKIINAAKDASVTLIDGGAVGSPTVDIDVRNLFQNVQVAGDIMTGPLEVPSGATGAEVPQIQEIQQLVSSVETKAVLKTGSIMVGPLIVPAGATGNKVPQAQEVVRKLGDTMTGALSVPAGAVGDEVPQMQEIEQLVATEVAKVMAAMPVIPVIPVIDSGYNGDGTWAKFPDGTMICTSPNKANYCNVAIDTIFTSIERTWSFPQAFKSLPVVVGSDNAPARWTNAHGVVVGSCHFHSFSHESSTTATQVTLIAIGRWK